MNTDRQTTDRGTGTPVEASLRDGLIMRVEVLSMEMIGLCRNIIYTDNSLQLNLGFKSSPQTMVFTLNLEKQAAAQAAGADPHPLKFHR